MPYRERRNHYKRQFARDNGMTLFTRASGVVCVEAPNIIPNRRSLDDVWGFVYALRSRDLDWVWLGGSIEMPVVLSGATEHALIADLRAGEDARHWPHTTLVGVDPGRADELAPPDAFAAALLRFAATEDGPIRIVVFQIGGAPEQRVFLPHQRVRAVDELLTEFGIGPDLAARQCEYVPRSGITLEALYRAS